MKNLNKIFTLMAADGMKHFILSCTLTALLALALPSWVAALVVLAIGLGKEIYDRVSGRGCAEWKDVLFNLCGIIIGMI